MKNREAKVWGAPDQEWYGDTEFGSAVEGIIDDCWPDVPVTIFVVGMAPREAKLDPSELVVDVLEMLDDEYGFDNIDTEPTEAMIDAAKTFAHVVLSEYEVRQLEEVSRVEVNTLSWTKTHDEDMHEELLRMRSSEEEE